VPLACVLLLAAVGTPRCCCTHPKPSP
jgi:hypothetical protein